MPEHETLLTLLADPNHWAFEVIVTLVVDGLVLGTLWPLGRAWLARHDAQKHAKDPWTIRYR